MRHSIPLTLGTIALLTACSRDRAASTDSTGASASAGRTSAAAAPAATAASGGVTITSPTEGATTGKDVTVTMRAEGVTIAKADGGKVEGVGHYHLFLDTIPASDTLPIPAGNSKIVHIGTGDSTYTFKNLPAGPHRLIAVIGYGNHAPLQARRDTVNFTVKP
jgi:hypothetical protein